jgi:hypothetical protein
MAPGALLQHHSECAESRPSKKAKTSPAADSFGEDAAVATAVPAHPLGIKPAGNAYTSSENLKSRCGSFARLPEELLSHMLESFEADTLIRLGSTCRALYAFSRLDDLWRALFVGYVSCNVYTLVPSFLFRLVASHCSRAGPHACMVQTVIL